MRLSPYGLSRRCFRLSVVGVTVGVKKSLMTVVRISRELRVAFVVASATEFEDAAGEIR